MQLVVDANILLSALLKEAVTRELLLDARLFLIAPEHLLTELNRHLHQAAVLRKRIALSEPELRLLFETLTQRIQTIPKQSYQPYMGKSLEISPHPKDAPYLAVAFLYDIPIWSNDKGLRTQQSQIKVYSTHRLLALLSKA